VARNADDQVELIELDVITRYSLAVRSATASREELISVLRDDLRWLEGGRATRRASPAKKSAPAKKTPSRVSTKKTTSRRSAR